MPAKSRAQFRMMQAAAHGKARNVQISREKAKEYVKGVAYKRLPEKAAKSRGRKRLASLRAKRAKR